MIFLSAGGLTPLKTGIVLRRELALMTILTIVGSALGAAALLRIPVRALQLVAIAMIVVAMFSLSNRNLRVRREAKEAVTKLADSGLLTIQKVL